MEYPTNSTNDMASAAKLMPKFTGADTEDSTIWIRDCKLVAKMAGFSEETTIRAMVLALDGSARTWASQTLQNMTDITLHDLENIITRRFSYQNTIDSTLSRFMNTKTVQSYTEFATLMQDATYLFNETSYNMNH